MIEPHGGRLVNLIVNDTQIIEKAKKLKRVYVSKSILQDIQMLAIGGFSPLEGFMNYDDYISCIKNMRLKNGTVFPIPVVFDHSERLKGEVAIYDGENLIGVLSVEDIFENEPEFEAENVYKTLDTKHPGVRRVFERKKYLHGGKLKVIDLPEKRFSRYNLKPLEVREIIKKRGFKAVAGFQTRNPIHRAHEYLIKCAVEVYDGVLIHPLVGLTKEEDIPAEVRMQCYEVLIENYFNKDRVILAIYPANMYYAGPREAVLHAIVRKNYGCTHFIVGRDHAGVGNYYGPYDAHKIFSEFKPHEIGITPVFFENAGYCKKCMCISTPKTCPHGEGEKINLSGTRLREMLKKGLAIPEEFSRKEVIEILRKYYINSW